MPDETNDHDDGPLDLNGIFFDDLAARDPDSVLAMEARRAAESTEPPLAGFQSRI